MERLSFLPTEQPETREREKTTRILLAMEPGIVSDLLKTSPLGPVTISGHVTPDGFNTIQDILRFTGTRVIVSSGSCAESLGELPITSSLVVILENPHQSSLKEYLNSGMHVVSQQDGLPDFIQTVQAAESGNSYITPKIRDALFQPPPKPQLPNLTPRETEVLNLIMRGYSNETIAAELTLSKSTVETHINNLNQKTRTSGKVGLLIHAIKNGVSLP